MVDGKPQFVDLTGNLIPLFDTEVSAVSVPFRPFHANQLPMNVVVRDIADIPTGVLSFTKCPRSSVDERALTPICLLRATLPDSVWTPQLRKSRQQGAAGDVEYVPPDTEKPKKLEWPRSDDESPETTLPVQAAYASKEIAKKPMRIPPVEGDMKSRKEVTEEQQALADGSTIKRQIAVVTSFRPVTEFPSIDDDFKEPKVHEKTVRVDVEETSVHLPPGVVEPYGSNVVTSVNTEKYEDMLQGGIPRTRTVTALTVKLKPSSDEMVPVDIEPEYDQRTAQQQGPKSALERMEDLLKSNEDNIPPSADTADMALSPVIVTEGGPEKPRIFRRFGAVSSKTELGEDEETLSNGTTVKWKTTTTKFEAPVFEVSEFDGRSSERLVGEKLIRTNVQEVVMRMAPGILYPYGSDIESETTETQFEDTLPDGSKLKKNVINIDVRHVQPDACDVEDPSSGVTPMPSDTGIGKYLPDSQRNVKPEQFPLTPLLSKGEGLPRVQPKVVTPGEKPVEQPAATPGHRVPTGIGVAPFKSTHPQDPILFPPGTLPTSELGSTTPTNVSYRSGIPETGTGIPRKTTKEYRRGLSNGDVLIQKVTAIQHPEPEVSHDTDPDKGPSTEPEQFPLTPLSSKGEGSPHVQPAGIEIEENVLRLPSGIIEPGGNNVSCDIQVAKSDEQTPDGIPMIKKTVTADVHLKTPTGSPKPSRIVKGDTQSRSKTLEDRYNLDDGTLVAEKTTETDYFKPVVEVRSIDGKEVRLPLREEPVKVESLRNVLELHPGVIEPYGSNVTTDVTVDNFDEKLPNGVPVKRKVVKLVVTTDKNDVSSTDSEADKQPTGSELSSPGKPDGSKVPPIPGTGDVFAMPKSDVNVPVPVPYTGPPGESKPVRPTTAGSATPQKKIIEAPIKSKIDVSEDERLLPSGGLLKHRVTTVTHSKTVEEVTVINGNPESSSVHEKLVDKEIEESYTELPPGVKSPYGPDVESETTVDRLDDDIVDGVLTKRTVRKTKVHRKPISATPALRDLLHEIENTVADTETAAVNKINEILSPPEGSSDSDKTLYGIPSKDGPEPDGEVRSRTSVLEFQRCLHDGTMIRRIVSVTQHYVSVPESLGSACSYERSPIRRGERVVDVEIDENLIALPPGIAEPNGDNCDTTISVQKSERTLADGTPVRKTAATTVVTLSPPRTRLVEGDVEHRTNVEQDQKCLPDGSTIRRKIITTRKIRPVTEVTLSDGKEVVKFLREKVVGATIEENILELPPGVIEPSGANCDTDITVSQQEDALADGTPAKRKTVRMVVRIKGQTKAEKLPPDEKPAPEPKQDTDLDGVVRCEAETKQYEENLEDGTSIVRKVITTKHIKSITEYRSQGHDADSEPVMRDKVVSVDIEENILQLPPGVIEPFAKNCDNDISVDHSEQTSVDGVVIRRKVVKMTVRLKQADEVKPAPPITKTIEGDAVERVDVKESEKLLNDGTKATTKRVTKKRVRPVTDVTVVDGVPTVTNYHEVALDATIDETVQELGPGVTEPRETDKVNVTTNVEHSQETLPDGIRAAKTVTTTSYHRTAEPDVTQKFIEGPVEARTNVTEDSKRLGDGTVVKRRVETTTYVKPVRVITRTDGVVTDSKLQEEVISMEVNEHVTEMLPGVVEPFGDDVQTSSSEQNFQETTPDGTPLKRKLVRVTASLRAPANPHTDGKERRIRRIGVEGEMMENTVAEDDAVSSDDGGLVSPTDGPSPIGSELDLHMFGVYANVLETEPQVEKDVQEYEETLPDSTVVRKRIVTTVEKKTVLMRALLPEDESGAAAEPSVQRYIDVTEEEPQVVTDVYDTAETLPDGALAKKRVKTTGQRRLTTQRKLIAGHPDDEELLSSQRQAGYTSAFILFLSPVLALLTPMT